MRKLVTQKKLLYRFYDFKRGAASNGTSQERRIGRGKVFLLALLLVAARRRRRQNLRPTTRPRAVQEEFIWHSRQEETAEIADETRGCVDTEQTSVRIYLSKCFHRHKAGKFNLSSLRWRCRDSFGKRTSKLRDLLSHETRKPQIGPPIYWFIYLFIY